jgi:hypothetical protein
MTPLEWPVDPRGQWSARQVPYVLEANATFCLERGIELRVLDISTWGEPFCRLITVHCRRHAARIDMDAGCPRCVKESTDAD